MLFSLPLRHRSLCVVCAALWAGLARAHDVPAASTALQFRIVIPSTVAVEYVPRVLAFLAPDEAAWLRERHPGADAELPGFRVGPALSAVGGPWVLPGRAQRLGSRRVGHTFVVSVPWSPAPVTAPGAAPLPPPPHRLYTVSSP